MPWEKVNKNIYGCTIGTSVFKYAHWGVPNGSIKEKFFILDEKRENGLKEGKGIISFNNRDFAFVIRQMTEIKHKRKNPEYRIKIQDPDFRKILKERYPEWDKIKRNNPLDFPRLTFTKTGNKKFLVEIQRNDTSMSNPSIKDVKKLQKVTTRLANLQKRFKNQLINVWDSKCPITGINEEYLLIGAHIKPFAKCNKDEAFDVCNGILLSPIVDKLFETGYISFADSGSILISSKLNKKLYKKFLIKPNAKIIKLKEEGYKKYLNWHRKNRFEK